MSTVRVSHPINSRGCGAQTIVGIDISYSYGAGYDSKSVNGSRFSISLYGETAADTMLYQSPTLAACALPKMCPVQKIHIDSLNIDIKGDMFLGFTFQNNQRNLQLALEGLGIQLLLQ